MLYAVNNARHSRYSIFDNRLNIIRTSFVFLSKKNETHNSASITSGSISEGCDKRTANNNGANIGQKQNIGKSFKGRSGKIRKIIYKSENRIKVVVYAYQNPVKMERVDIMDPWYKEGKILRSDNWQVIALRNGYRIAYSVQQYDFHKVTDNPSKLKGLYNHIKMNPKRTYSGWIHHANHYGGITKRFIRSEKLNFDL